MIEAVNSVLANAPLIKSLVSEGNKVQEAAVQGKAEAMKPLPKAPYVSPYVSIDVETDKAVLQIRDSETGAVIGTLSGKGVEEQRRADPEGDAVRQNFVVSSDLLIAQESNGDLYTVTAKDVAASFQAVEMSITSGAGNIGKDSFSDKV